VQIADRLFRSLNSSITAIAITTASSSRFSGIEIFNGPVLGEFNISNNTIGSLVTPDAITFTSTAAAGAELYGIRYVVPYNVNMSHNNVGGITASSSSGGVIRLTGLLARSIESETNSMVGNTVGSTAAPISNNASASGSQTIGLHCQVGKCSLTNNEIGNLTMNGANTGLRAGTSLVGMMVDSPASLWSSDVFNNTIHSLSHTHPSADVAVSGLYYRGTGIGSLGGNVSRNLIYGISTSSSGAGASVTGIDIDGPAIYNVFTNNMIALGGDMTANSPQIFGFSERFGATGNDLQFNSVYIGGSGVASGSGSSAAMFSTVANSTRTYRNNIFVNARSNGAATGKHYAVTLGGTTFNPTGLTSNNNVLFASGVGGVTGFFNGAERATLASWQAATGQDADSFAADPNFLAPSASVPDLHINPTVLSVIEGNGFSPDLWALDFDGETRSTLTPVDIGADAGNFIGADLLRPRIVYTPLANTQSMSNRALGGVAITDKSGVNTAAGSKPRVYYKRSTDGNVWNDNTPGTDGWKYAEASGASSPFDFTLDYARLNGGTGVSLGATVQYFVVAQDLAAVPNVGINSGLFASAPTSVALTTAAFPVSGAINSYQITQNFAGVYSVPGMFPSLTNAGGIFQAMQVGQLTGNVVIEITADLTGETGQFSLTQLAEAPAGSNFTVTIKPSGAARTITAAETARWVIRLAGADRVTIDGSLNGGDDRSLTISNPNPGAGSPSVVLLVSAGVGAGATNNTIKNCIIVGGSVGSSSVATFGIGSGGVGALQGPDNDNLTIRNNVIRRVRFGIQAFGGASAPNDNLQIVGNILGDDLATDSIGSIAMNIAYARNSTFSQNIVKNVANSYGSPYGIRFVDGVLSSSAMRNNITGIRHTGTGGFGGVGIELTAQSGANQVTLANNFISDIGGDGSNNALTNGIAGIRLLGGGSGVSLYYNSVNLGSGSFGGNANGTQSAALAVSNSLAGLDIRNNIFATNLVNTNAPAAKTYAILTTATSGGVFGAINHNDYYVTGAQGVLGRLNSVDRTTLADWQTASGQDANSIAADPVFISPTDLHIDPTALRLASPVDNAGTPIAGITDDFDGGPRDAITPDIGGDEIGSALAVTLVDFNAAQVGDLVQVTWETVSEIDNAGFNLYRTGSVGDRPEPSDLLAYVPSQAPGSTQGAAYTYEDAAVEAGQTYWYWLEDVDLSGATTLHGPVSATVQTPTAVTLSGLEAATGGTS
jgi:trimeric autotransporter adhesin